MADTALSLALRKKFKTREEVFARLGLNPVTFDEESPMATSYTRDRGYTRLGRLGRDEEEGHQELRALCDDPDCDFGDLLAAAIYAASPEQHQEVHEALRELGQDRRGPRSWAADRLERRRLGRDMRERAQDPRLGRDDPPPFSGRPNVGGGMDPFNDRPIENFGRSEDLYGGLDRRRMGADAMAMDGRVPSAGPGYYH
jgi:hypothetical protein